MKKLFYPLFLITIITGLISCQESEENKQPKLQDIASLSQSSKSNRVVFIDGEKLEQAYANLVAFTVLDTISKNNDEIHEANMQLVLPGWMPVDMGNLQFARPIFHVKATSSEANIVFSGDFTHKSGQVNYSVEGYFKPETLYTADTLHINTKRTAPVAPLAGNTYELTLDENTFNFSDFDTNGSVDNRQIYEYGKEGMPLYIEHLKAMTNEATYRFTFLVDGTLNIQKKDASMTDFESIPGKFNYYLVQQHSDRGKGIIELPTEIAKEFDTLLKGDVIPGSMSSIYEEVSFPSNDRAIIPFEFITQHEGMNGLFMLALGDWGSDNLKLIGLLSEWRAHSTNYNDSLRNEAIDVFIGNWLLNSQTDNLWWNLKKI